MNIRKHPTKIINPEQRFSIQLDILPFFIIYDEYLLEFTLYLLISLGF